VGVAEIDVVVMSDEGGDLMRLTQRDRMGGRLRYCAAQEDSGASEHE
jgi:hypothetical protein